MGRVTILPGLSQVRDWEDLRRFTSMIIEAIIAEINGKLTFAENMQASGPHEVTFDSSSDVVAVPHTLSRIPSGFIVVNLNAAITLYQPTAPAWLKDQVFLKASGAGTAKIFVV